MTNKKITQFTELNEAPSLSDVLPIVDLSEGLPANQNKKITVANFLSLGVIISNTACDASVSVGDIVRVDSATFVKAIATSEINSNVIGICISKPTSITCNVQTHGLTPAIFSGLDVTKNYLLSDSVSGALTYTAPTASGSIVIPIGRAYSATRFVIIIGQQLERA